MWPAAAEEHDGAEQLVGALCRELAQQLELVPILGRLYALASDLRHGPTSYSSCRDHCKRGWRMLRASRVKAYPKIRVVGAGVRGAWR